LRGTARGEVLRFLLLQRGGGRLDSVDVTEECVELVGHRFD
jgi:hypothetical protein